MTSQRQKTGGFTILEILISVAILALMVLSMTGITDNILRRQRRADRRQETRHAVAVALLKMMDDLRTAFQADSRFFGQDDFYQTGFVGDGTRVNFSTMGNVHFVKNRKETDQVHVGYSLVRNDEGNYDLVRRQTAHLTDDLESGGHSFVLIKNVKEMELTYYDSNKKEWQDKWDTRSVSAGGRLPQAVRIKITVFGEPLLEDEAKLKEYYFELQVPIEMYAEKISF